MPPLRVIGTFFCAALLLLNSATAFSVERIKPDDYSGHWLLEGYEIFVVVPCGVSKYSLLPTKHCSEPYIVIEESKAGSDTLLKPHTSFNLVAGEISIGDKSRFDGNDDPMKKVHISDITIGPQRSYELFTLLMSAPNTTLIFKIRGSGNGSPITIRKVVLADFEASTSELIRAIHQRYDHEEADLRRSKLLGLCLIGGILAFALWLVLFLLKRGRTRLQVAKQEFAMKRVARIAEDEAIRVAVRKSVEVAEEEDIQALKDRIKVALDAGDTETATTLLGILKKQSALSNAG